jgi:hypothetical protein
MAGQIKQLIDTIIQQRAQGNTVLAKTTKTKLVLKGIDPDHFDGTSPDDPAIIARVRAIAAELKVSL